jgi:hypothetical protein
VHTSDQALEHDIRDWIATWNTNPRPFTWTKTADEILNSLAGYLAKLGTGRAENEAEINPETSGAGHWLPVQGMGSDVRTAAAVSSAWSYGVADSAEEQHQ